MRRTCRRPLPSGRVTADAALRCGIALALGGSGDADVGPVRKLMHRLGTVLETDAAGEQIGAVRLFQRLDRARDLATAGPLRRRLTGLRGGRVWPTCRVKAEAALRLGLHYEQDQPLRARDVL